MRTGGGHLQESMGQPHLCRQVQTRTRDDKKPTRKVIPRSRQVSPVSSGEVLGKYIQNTSKKGIGGKGIKGPSTTGISGFVPSPTTFDELKTQSSNWERPDQYQVQKVLRQLGLVSKRNHLCLNSSFTGKEVRVSKKLNGGTRMSGLSTCNLDHQCPVCRKRKQEEKKERLEKVLKHSREVLGTTEYFLTLTIPHNRKMSFRETQEILQGGWKNLQDRLKKYLKEWGFVWGVRGDDYTYGKNGHHIHFHNVLSLEIDVPIEEMEKVIHELWGRSVTLFVNRKNNNTPDHLSKMGTQKWMNEHTIDLRKSDENVGDYLLKWKTSNEVVDTYLKQGKGSNLSVGEMETLVYHQYEERGEVDSHLTNVLREYYEGMKGRKSMNVMGRFVEIEKELEEMEEPEMETIEEEETETEEYDRHGVIVRSPFWNVMNRKCITHDLIRKVSTTHHDDWEDDEIREWLIGKVEYYYPYWGREKTEFVIDKSVQFWSKKTET